MPRDFCNVREVWSPELMFDVFISVPLTTFCFENLP